jgi:hypothetical protein
MPYLILMMKIRYWCFVVTRLISTPATLQGLLEASHKTVLACKRQSWKTYSAMVLSFVKIAKWSLILSKKRTPRASPH